MKFCLNCGAELKPEAKFCTACGTPVVAETPPPVEPTPVPQPVYQPQEPVYEQAKEATAAFKEAIIGNTNIVQRVINIITKPKQEWLVIATEKPNPVKLIGGYAFILILIPVIASFLAYGIIKGISQLFSAVIGVYLLSYIIDLLGPSFDSDKEMGKSIQLAVFSSTPVWLAGILLIIPKMEWLGTLIGVIYFIYLLSTGLPILKRTPKEKVTGYVALSTISMIIISLVLMNIFEAMLGYLIG